MLRGMVIGASVAAAISATPAAAATRTIVLHAQGLVSKSVLLQGSDANPVRLLSFEVTPTETGRVELDGSRFNVVPNQTYFFAPNLPVNSNIYGQYYGNLRLLNVGNVEAVATWRNVTLELGDQVSPAPEPAAWAMMIVGFGLAGALARTQTRRRVAA